ncbi:MAG TPA: hypothetical protein VKZ53_18545 [Candidatus Angelobacter sp.]|nr:hypothetical protein [Candidatus Angelobacter sp.]
MKRIGFALAALCAALSILTLPAAAQNNAFDSQFGATPWAQNGVRTASAYSWIIDNTAGGYLNFTFPSPVCTGALYFGGRGNVNPFTATIADGPTQATPNITVKFLDAVAANNETVALNSNASVSGGFCTLSPANVNQHLSYKMVSGTCGLQEAINDAGTAGGIVEYTQESVALGCSGASAGVPNPTITAAKAVLPNIYVHDISNGANQWYAVKGTSLALVSAPTALTTAGGAAATLQTSTSGGSIATGQAVRAGITCVDFLGRETALSTDTAGTAVVTTGAGSTNTITVTAPGTAGCPNSVGYRVYLSASGGASLSEILYAPVAAGCTASGTSVVVSACALTSNAVVASLTSNTAGVPTQGAASLGLATATGLLPVSNLPTNPGFQTVYGPFSAITAVTTAQIAAEVPLPAQFFNTGLEKAYRVTLSGVGTAAAATVAGSFKLTLGPRQGTSPTGVQTIDTVNFTASTIWPAAAANWTYSTVCSVAATGTSGTLECQSDTGFIVSTTAAAAPPAFGPQLDSTTGPSTALDLTQQLYIDAILTASASSFTSFTVRKVAITPVYQ